MDQWPEERILYDSSGRRVLPLYDSSGRRVLPTSQPKSPTVESNTNGPFPGSEQLDRHVRRVVAAQDIPAGHAAAKDWQPKLLRTVSAGPTVSANTAKLSPVRRAPAVIYSRPAANADSLANPVKQPSLQNQCLELLQILNLTHAFNAAICWIDEMGACSVNEIADNVSSFADSLDISAQERSRLCGGVRTAAHMVSIKSSPAPAKSTVLTHDTLKTVMSAPVTYVEQTRAQDTLLLALVDEAPIPEEDEEGETDSNDLASDDDESFAHSPECDMEDKFHQHYDEHPRSRCFAAFNRWCSPPKHRWRVDDKLLRERIPSRAELDAVQRARDKVKAAMIAEWGEAEEKPWAFKGKSSKKPRNVDGQDAMGSFQNLRREFLRRYRTAIVAELGPGVQLEEAKLADQVQQKFLKKIRHTKIMPTFGYHGTKEKNIPSILKRGLLLPGKESGVSVAHGSADGVGIYTAMPGASGLSRDFCDSSKMLVCGVLDKDVHPTDYVEARHYGWPNENRASEGLKVRGAARILFDDRLVAPLFVATMNPCSAIPDAKFKLPPNAKLNPPNREHVATGQFLVKGDSEQNWIPPEEERGWNQIRVKRRVVAKDRDLQRKGDRAVKLAARSPSATFE